MKTTFDGSETIADILLKLPEASEILASHGLSCASCHLNQEEPLREGALSHGFTEDDVIRILDDLHEALESDGPPSLHEKMLPPRLTKKASEMVMKLQKEQGAEGQGLKIEVEATNEGFHYFLDFLKKPEPGDRTLCSEDFRIFIDSHSLKRLQNIVVDYGEKGGQEGFMFEKREDLS